MNLSFTKKFVLVLLVLLAGFATISFSRASAGAAKYLVTLKDVETMGVTGFTLNEKSPEFPAEANPLLMIEQSGKSSENDVDTAFSYSVFEQSELSLDSPGDGIELRSFAYRFSSKRAASNVAQLFIDSGVGVEKSSQRNVVYNNDTSDLRGTLVELQPLSDVGAWDHWFVTEKNDVLILVHVLSGDQTSGLEGVEMAAKLLLNK